MFMFVTRPVQRNSLQLITSVSKPDKHWRWPANASGYVVMMLGLPAQLIALCIDQTVLLNPHHFKKTNVKPQSTH